MDPELDDVFKKAEALECGGCNDGKLTGGAVRAAVARLGDAGIEATEAEAPPPADLRPITQWVIADIYRGDLGALPRFSACAATPWCGGVIIKCVQGARGYAHEEWFLRNWERVKAAAGDRYGVDFVRGAYTFLNLWQRGRDQAHYMMRTVEKAGGWDLLGDSIPWVDAEQGQPGSANSRVSVAQVIDCVSEAAETLRLELGRPVGYYGRGISRDLRIRSKMGCKYAWNASYTRVPRAMPLPWQDEDVALWQYTDGEVEHPRLPMRIEGFGDVDLSVRGGTRERMIHVLVKGGEG